MTMALTPNAVADPLIELVDLKTHFFTDEGVVKALDGVTFSVPRGKTLCVVGESGCGKSVTGRSMLQIVDRPGRIVGGKILYHPTPGETIDITSLRVMSREMRAIRGGEIGMIFQEPMTSLGPIQTIGKQIGETIMVHKGVSKAEARNQTIELLRRVGIPRPETRLDAYPFELSGGMRQRAMIALGLCCNPKLLIADEPTTALDVTTQAVILDLIKELQDELGMAVMFITHDLGVVAEIADDVVVMYLGQVAEHADVDTIFKAPKHPYTRALLRSIPRLGGSREPLQSIKGMVPHPFRRPTGCNFHTRCPEIIAGRCERIDPAMTTFPDGTQVRCLLHSEQGAEAVS
jgi:oligopeptide/dipeptide ABC transporter ATP-binding protein